MRRLGHATSPGTHAAHYGGNTHHEEMIDMGLLDKAKQLAGKNKGKVADGVDKATDVVDSKTGAKHTKNLQKVDDAADKWAGKTPDASS